MKRVVQASLTALCLALSSTDAGAACTSPAAAAGSLNWNVTAFQFCDGTAWQAFNGSQWSNGASSAIYYNAGNVGIGTNSPSVALHVVGNIDLSGSDTRLLRFRNAADTDHASIGVLNGGLALSAFSNATAPGAAHILIENSGNVGIGTTTPGSTLDVKGTLRLSGSTSGYVGLAPAAAAGATTYTLPSADGSSGQVLSTNGSGTLSWATAGGASGSNFQSFTASGTWTKPGTGNVAMIECWGGGGSGGRYYGSGGGGGGYNSRTMDLSTLPATVAVTIGAGGTSKTTNGTGSVGGNSSFGSYLTAYGGGAGGSGLSAYEGGGGGGPLSAGSSSATCSTNPGLPRIVTGVVTISGYCGYSTCYADAMIYQGQVSCTATANSASTISAGPQPGDRHGGGGGSYSQAGAASVFGGGGGGGGYTATAGGSSSFGGNGGAGASGTATAGSQPGGGGGGTHSGNSGAGGAGKCSVTVW